MVGTTRISRTLGLKLRNNLEQLVKKTCLYLVPRRHPLRHIQSPPQTPPPAPVLQEDRLRKGLWSGRS